MKNILQYLEKTVRQVPYNLFLAEEQGAMTFREVYDQARAIGSYLILQGIAGKPVAILLEEMPRAVTAFLGAVYGGNPGVPLDPKLPGESLEQILKSLEPGAVICREAAMEQLRGWGIRCFSYDQAAFGVIQEEALAQIRETQVDTDPVSILRGEVVGCHRALIEAVEETCPILEISSETVFAAGPDSSWMAEWIPAMKYGCQVHRTPQALFFSPEQLADYLNRNQITALCWPGMVLAEIASSGALEGLRSQWLKTVAFTGEDLSGEQLELWQKALPEARLIHLYGTPETTGACSWYEGMPQPGEPIPIGRPFPNTQILVLNDQGQPVRPEEPGEVYVRGTRLALGYYRRKETVRFIQNPMHCRYRDPVYRTGKVGMYNCQGELVLRQEKHGQNDPRGR